MKIKYEEGYKLLVEDNYLVPAIQSGVVVFIGNKDNIGNVITIEGEDGSTVTYGNIKNTDIKLYEYINKGKYLGETENNTFNAVAQVLFKYQASVGAYIC